MVEHKQHLLLRCSHCNKTMAAGSVSTSMAAELLHKMNPYQYKEYCAVINKCDSVSVSFYKASKWVNYFALDTALTFRNGKVNNDHVYELFGSFNGLSATVVRKNLINFVGGNMEFVTKRSTVCLSMRGMAMDTWIENIKTGEPCDELALLTLSMMYHRHSLVVTKSKSWCTIASPTPMNLLQAMSACTVRLLYLGNLTFGVLKWKPQIPKPVVDKPRLGEFKVVEEYTLDEQQATFKKLAVVKPHPVETRTSVEQSGASTHTTVSNEAELQPHSFPRGCIPEKEPPPKPTVVYASANTDFYVGTTPDVSNQERQLDMVSSENYPWKKKLCVSVRRLSDFEISYWCGGLKQASAELPIKVETIPVKSIVFVKDEAISDEQPTCNIDRKCSHLDYESPVGVKRSPSSEDQTTEKLLAHAKSLISHVSKALGTSDELKTRSDNTDRPSLKPSGANSAPPSASIRVETNQKPKSVRKQIKCQMCDFTCISVEALKDHHSKDHGILHCKYCDKAFSSKPSLDKHMYVHTNMMAYVCEECGQGFPFKSQMLQHKITHSTDSRFKCKRGNCGKSFKNKGDLTRHEISHDNNWYYCAHCPYKNKDKRNRDSHSRTHEPEGEERYHCEKCGKGMRFSTQMKHHHETGCDLSTFHV